MRFKTVEDQAACILEVRDTPAGEILIVDASGCQHESRIYFEIPERSDLLLEAPGGSTFAITYKLSGQALTPLRSAGSPLREPSLIELGTDGSEKAAHSIRKKLVLEEHLTKHKLTQTFTRPVADAHRYAFGFRIAPAAGAFSIAAVGAEVRRISTPLGELEQVATRIQGKFARSSASCPELVFRSDDARVAQPISINERNGFHLVEAGGFIEFDISAAAVRRLLPERESFGGAFAVLKLSGQLAAACQCDLAAGVEAVAPSQLHANADSNHEILAAADFELSRRRSGAALRLLSRLTNPSPKEQRLGARIGMRALLGQRRFEEAVALFESVDPPMSNDVKSLTRYVEACASTGRLERAREELEKVVSGPAASSPEMLARLYRYSSLLPEASRSLFAQRLLAVAGELRSNVKSLVHLGHYFAARGDVVGLSRVLARLESFDLDAAEKARLPLLRAQLAHGEGDRREFLERLNEALHILGVPPISLVDPATGFALGNLMAGSSPADDSGPLVSIVMTAFNSQATIGYAMKSILGQSYRNLELLVVDDCSNDGTREIISEAARRDPRVIPIFSPSNSGTYVCKNLALPQARGEYISCHDSDDWAHPRKIETCISRLGRDGSLVATGVQVVRYSPSDGLQFRGDYIQPDAPSLMYRAEPVRRTLGFYDSVRVAADTEFERRMKLAFGSSAVRYGEELLTVGLWSGSTLTGGGSFAIDNDSGLMAPLRNDYRREFLMWHESTDSLYMEFPLKERPFPAPREILPERV